MAYVKQWAPRSFRPLELRVPGTAGGGADGRCGATRCALVSEPGPLRPRLPRSAVQPAPVLHQLPRLGDPRRLGRTRALRRGLQACRRPRPEHQERLQLQADDGRPRWREVVSGVDCGLLILSYNDESWVDARRAGGDVHAPAPAGGHPVLSTRPATSGRASASTTRPASRWARCRTCSTTSTSSSPANVRTSDGSSRRRPRWPTPADEGEGSGHDGERSVTAVTARGGRSRCPHLP